MTSRTFRSGNSGSTAGDRRSRSWSGSRAFRSRRSDQEHEERGHTSERVQHTHTIGAGAPDGPIVYDEWQGHWLGGLIGERTHNVSQICPSGNATIHDEQTFLNGLVGVLTAVIYTPTKLTIRCSTGQRVDIVLSEEEVLSILIAPAFREQVAVLLPDRLHELEPGIEALEEDVADAFLDG